MKDLSIGAKIAWKIAAMEAGASKHQFIEAEHIFIGICSLGKVLALRPEDSGLNQQERKALKDEYAILQDLMKDLGLDMAQLRRGMRKQLGTGNYAHEEKTIHRSTQCKKIFDIANSFPESDEKITSLHLLGAVWEEPMRGHVLARIDNLKQQGKEMVNDGGEKDAVKAEPRESEGGTPFLNKYGRDYAGCKRQ